jgi:hypothetical protein
VITKFFNIVVSFEEVMPLRDEAAVLNVVKLQDLAKAKSPATTDSATVTEVTFLEALIWQSPDVFVAGTPDSAFSRAP